MPRKSSSAAFEQETSLSQADTEPLSFDDENEENEQTETKQANGTMTDRANEDAPGSIQASPADTSMEDTSANAAILNNQNHLSGEANGQDDAEGDEADAVGSDEEDLMRGEDDTFGDSREQDTQNEDDAGVMHTSNTGAAFSDDSELTDESDDDEDAEGEAEAEAEEEDDDEMGGDDDDDEDEDAEGEDEEEDDEDEAAKGLAALTAAAEQDGDAQNVESEAASGLDGLAVLAAAGAGDSDQLQADGSDSDSTLSSRTPSTINSRQGCLAAKPRLGSRLNEVMLASEPTSDQDDLEDGEEEEEGTEQNEMNESQQDGGDDESQQGSQMNKRPKSHSQQMSSLGHLATAAKRSATRPGPAAGLLAGAPSITIDEAPSGAASAASSREASPKLEDKDDEDEEHKDVKKDEEDGEGDEKEREVLETPILETEEAVAEEETSTDEAAIKRQEAMEALTKIEIGFAVLRDKLYVERMDEISKESEMILEGTHPDLIYLTNFIEARRERRLKLVEMWFEQQQKQYERVAHTEEAAAWNNWRNEVVHLRKEKLDDISRKRRKLDREKRTLDGPRPARRHQIFETELVRNPDFDAAQAKANGRGESKRKNDPRQQELEDLEEMGAYVAYPDLRGAEEGEAWMDLERMGVQPDVRLMPGVNYYRMDEMGMDPYGNMYVMDGGAQQPPPGVELMPPFAGGPAPNNMMLERGGFDSRDRGMQPGMVIDGYGLAPPSNQFGGPPPNGPRGNGGSRIQNENGMGGAMPSANPASSSKRRAGTPSGVIKTPKQSGAILDDRVGRKSEGQSTKRARSPAQTGASRKSGASSTTTNSHRNVSQNASQRNFDGMMQGGKMPYAGPPREMHDERFYDGPLPPSHMGGPPPPGTFHGGGTGKMPPGPGAGFPHGHMMGSPVQPVSQQLGPAPPPPPMNHPMHGSSGGFPTNRRTDGIYPH